ncbi:MAG: tRNA (adenosine(37)-N6)-threonylcarbamoyltransferase complex ATPase subunit type 1 TsaE [Gemmatimonadales bacterium]
MRVAELSLAELTQWGESLGAGLTAPCVVTLEGDLGAGKTTLAQAIARGYGVRESVTSPTFAIVHEYHAPRSPVFHLDLYRLAGPHQLANIGWDDAVASRAILLVEWPDRAAGQLPPATHAIALAHVADKPDIRSVSW